MSKSRFFSAAALVLGAIALPGASYATVFTITQDNIGVNCSAGCGTVTVTDAGLSTNNTYTFNIDLTSALEIHSVDTGNNRAVAFNLAGVTGIASGPVDALVTNGSLTADGFGTNFSDGVACSSTTGNNICNPNGQSPLNDLIFSVFAPTGESLTLSNRGFPLALDVADPLTGNTGFASVPSPLIGHGLLVLLAVGGVLFGGKLLEGIKKRHLHAA